MHHSCLQKQQEIKASFSACSTSEDVYKKIIDWGKRLTSFNSEWKIDEHLVQGCQSLMYLKSTAKGEHIYFAASSDALISAGLAALLIYIYNGETAETILKCPPSCLEEINIPSSLTPGRANGLASMYTKMKQLALHLYMESYRC